MPSMQLSINTWQARGRRRVSRMLQGDTFIFKVIPCSFQAGVYHVMYANRKIGEIHERILSRTQVHSLDGPSVGLFTHTEMQKRQAIGCIAAIFIQVLTGGERDD